MWLPEDGKFTSRFKYIELARFVPSLDRVVRLMQNKTTPKIFQPCDIEKFRNENSNSGLYTSVFNYDNTDLTKASRLGSLYFDIDNSEIFKAQSEAIKLVEYLLNYIPKDSIRIYFTGKKGFHIECEAIALGVSASTDLPVLFRYIANQIKQLLQVECFDFSVYDLRRMWRLPHSKHQSTGLYKVPLNFEMLTTSIKTIEDFAREPHFEITVPAQEFSINANEWFREWQYRHETKEKVSLDEKIQRFNKFGNSLSFDDSNYDTLFNPEVFEKCSAIGRLWEKAEKEHDLTHEERLFLCSILTINKEAEMYLHSILGNCHDYSPDRTQSHIDDWVKRRELGIGGKPYSCDRANQAGVGCGNCSLEAKDKFVKVNNKLIKTGEKASPSPVRFAYKRKKIEGVNIQDQILPLEKTSEVFVWEDNEIFL